MDVETASANAGTGAGPTAEENLDEIDIEDIGVSGNGAADQLPAVEEYKASLDAANTSSSRSSRTIAATDQLPALEEYKASMDAANASSSSSSRTIRRWPLIIFVSLVVIALTGVFIAIGVTVTANKRNGEVHIEDLMDRKFRLAKVSNKIVSSSWSKREDLIHPGTPQYSAVNWIVTTDPKGIDHTDEELRDRYILAVLYMSLEGQQWDQDVDFMSKKHVCEWFDVWVHDKDNSNPKNPDALRTRVGVTCNDQQQVTSIFLPFLGLEGKIPSEIGFLDSLTELNLAGNAIRGALPASMSKLTKLTDLILHDNDIDGDFPVWLPLLTNLRHLHLASTDMTGTIPPLMSQMTNLEFFNMEDTYLESMSNLKGLTKLRAIFLGGCKLENGVTSEMLESWPNLEAIDVSSNDIVGSLPDNLFQMDKLRVVDFSDNWIKGFIPNAIPEFGSNLESLNLKENQLSLSIPAELGRLTDLTRLDLSMNEFTGNLTAELANLGKLEYLFLNNNPSLTAGPIPLNFGHLTNIKDLSLKDTKRTGSIPPSFNNLKNIILLDLGVNSLDDGLEFISDLNSLRFLFLNNNEFDGLIPSFEDLTHLVRLIWYNNNFIPPDTDSLYCTRVPEDLDEFVTDCKISFSGMPDCATKCCGGGGSCEKDDYDSEDNKEPEWNSPLKRAKYMFGDRSYDFEKDLDLTADDDDDDFEALQKKDYGWKVDEEEGEDDGTWDDEYNGGILD